MDPRPEGDPRAKAERRGELALVAGCVVGGMLGVIALGVSRDYGFGDSAGLAASAYDLGLPQSAEHPLWVLLARSIYALAPGMGPAWAANALTAVTGIVALAAVALACLEAVRTTRAPMPQCGYAATRIDYGIAGLCAACLLTSPALREALAHASTWPASLALGAAFVWLTQRWRRRGGLSPLDGFALVLVGGLSLTHEPFLISVLISGVLGVAFYGASMPPRGRETGVQSPSRRRRALGALAGVVLGLSPVLLSAWFTRGATADPMGSRTLGQYLLGGLGGPHFHDVGVLAAPMAARDALGRVLETVGVPLGLLAVLGVAWASVDRAIVGATAFGRSASAGLWPGALCFIVGWAPAWGYTGWDRTFVLLPCALGCALAAAAGAGMILEFGSRASTPPVRRRWVHGMVPTLLLGGLALNLAARPGRVGSTPRDLALATLSALPPNAVVVVGNDVCAPEHLVYPLAYERRVHGARPDATLIGMEGAFTDAEWDRISRAAGIPETPRERDPLERWKAVSRRAERPVVSTEWFDAAANNVRLAGPFVVHGAESEGAPARPAPHPFPKALSPLAREMRTAPLRVEAATSRSGFADALVWDAVADAPESAANHVAAAFILLRDGRADEALASADQARRLDPLCARAWLMRAEALERLSRRDEAIHSAEIAVSVSRRLRNSLRRSSAVSTITLATRYRS